MIAIANNATYKRRFKLHHGVPRHCHDVPAPFKGGREQDNRPGLKQAIHFGQRERFPVRVSLVHSIIGFHDSFSSTKAIT